MNFLTTAAGSSSAMKPSPNCTPTNISPITTPKTSSSPDHNKLTDPRFIDQYVGQRLMEEKTKTNTYCGMPSTRSSGPSSLRHFYNGLDTIPEYGITDPPSTFQPLVPPPVPRISTTSYNISFPTTLQPRDRFDMWRTTTSASASNAPLHVNSARYSSGTGSSCSSVPHSPGSSVTVILLLIFFDLIVTSLLIFFSRHFTRPKHPMFWTLVSSNPSMLSKAQAMPTIVGETTREVLPRPKHPNGPEPIHHRAAMKWMT